MNDKIREAPKFELPFPRSEFKDRLNRVRQAMQVANIDVAIATDQRDFYWLTGTRTRVTGAENPNWVIVWEGEPIGVVRHLEASTWRCCSILENWVEYPDEGPINPYDPVLYTANTLKDLGLEKRNIGLNFRIVSIEEYNRFKKLLPEAEFRDFRIERIRIQKSKLEQECQFRAAKANQDALMDTINEMRVGWSERDVIETLFEYHEKYLGSDYEYSRGMIQVGGHVMHMHITRWPPEERAMKIKKGDIIYLEPGTFVKRYVGSMIRMVSFGEPPEIVRKSAEASIEALNLAIEATAPGKSSHEVDKVARDYFKKLGLDCQGRIGYSSGIDWSEGLTMSIEPNNPLILQPGHIFHYIAINYLPGWGYIGASEQVLVTEDGHEVLADRDRTCPRQLFIK
jgi:Xaa-Pro aminopeptidase